MEYDAKRKLIDELSRQMSGKGIDEDEIGQLIAKFDASTNTLKFNLSGTRYSVEDMCRAKKYFQEKMNEHKRQGSERRIFYEIAVTCIEAVIDEFTQPVDNIIQQTTKNKI